MPGLFDPTMTSDEAVTVLTVEAIALAAGQWSTDSARLGHAIAAVLEDRLRLSAVRAVAADAREAQRRYFRERTTEALRRSKELERELDRLLAERTG